MVSSIGSDLRFGLRWMMKRPLFTCVTVLTLALGVGVNTAIFSLVNGVLLRPLPYPEPERVMSIWHRWLDGSGDFVVTTPGNFGDLREQSRSFTAMAAFQWTSRNVSGHGEPQRLDAVVETGSLFEALGVPPLLGRGLEASDEAAENEPVVVLSHAAWSRLFDASPAALGQTLTLDSKAHTIVGVMPPGFAFPDEAVQLWVPARWSQELRTSRSQYMLEGIGRLAPGVSREQAMADLETVMARLRTDYPEYNGKLGANVVPYHEMLVSDVQTKLLVLMGAVGFVLLICCANLTNLSLARSTARRAEMAVRMSVGASRGRLMQQLLLESLLLGVCGAAVGLVLGKLTLDLMLAYLPQELPRVGEIGLDGRVLAFTAAVSLVAAVFIGLAPARRLLSTAPRVDLAGSGRSTASRSATWTALVVAEVALAVVLLVGAGLLLRSFALLNRVDPGFPTERLMTFRLQLDETKYPDELQRFGFVKRALEDLAGLPSVESVGVTSQLPVLGRGIGAWFNRVDKPWPPGETPPGVPYRVISLGYLQTMGIPLIRGRALAESDDRKTPAVLVTESLAQRFYPNEEPIGKQIVLGPLEESLFPAATIVGVVADTKMVGLGARPLPAVYVPQAAIPGWRSYSVAVRTKGEPLSVVPAIRQALQALDPTLPLFQVRTMDQAIRETVAPERSATVLLGTFAAVAVLLAAVGVFGVLTYSVAQRRKELGIRLALGASPRQLHRMVLRQGMAQVVGGIGLGLLAAFALSRVLESMLFEVSARDPLTFAGVAALLAGVAAVASALPARQATRIDPMQALRHD